MEKSKAVAVLVCMDSDTALAKYPDRLRINRLTSLPAHIISHSQGWLF